jgi:hypothetical protein
MKPKVGMKTLHSVKGGRGGGRGKEEAKPDRSFTPQIWIGLIYAFTIAAAHILFIDEII